MTRIKTVPRIETYKGALKFIQNPIPVVDDALLKYGKTYVTRIIGGRRLIMTTEPHVVQHVLQKNHTNYIKSEIQTESLGRYVGKGLLTVNGPYWLQQRRLIQPGFHKSRLEELVRIVRLEIDAFISDLKNRITPDSKYDLSELMIELTLRIVSKSLFSTGINQEEIKKLGEDFTVLQEYIIKEIRQPQYNWYRRLVGKRKHALDLSQKVRGLMASVIADRKKEGNAAKHDDLLQMLIDARYKDSDKGMSDVQLIDEAIILFVAGHETTANAMTWAIYSLLKNPKHYQSIKREVAVQRDSSRDFKSVMEPNLIGQVCQETLRLYPPAWILDRKALGDDEVDGITIKKGDLLGLYTYGSHRDPDIWKDPGAFSPDRFSGVDRDKYSYYPFGGGPRLCIGHQFAMMEMKMALSGLMQHFDWSLESNVDVEPLPLLTLRPKESIYVRLGLAQ